MDLSQFLTLDHVAGQVSLANQQSSDVTLQALKNFNRRKRVGECSSRLFSDGGCIEPISSSKHLLFDATSLKNQAFKDKNFVSSYVVTPVLKDLHKTTDATKCRKENCVPSPAIIEESTNCYNSVQEPHLVSSVSVPVMQCNHFSTVSGSGMVPIYNDMLETHNLDSRFNVSTPIQLDINKRMKTMRRISKKNDGHKYTMARAATQRKCIPKVHNRSGPISNNVASTIAQPDNIAGVSDSILQDSGESLSIEEVDKLKLLAVPLLNSVLAQLPVTFQPLGMQLTSTEEILKQSGTYIRDKGKAPMISTDATHINLDPILFQERLNKGVIIAEPGLLQAPIYGQSGGHCISATTTASTTTITLDTAFSSLSLPEGSSFHKDLKTAYAFSHNKRRKRSRQKSAMGVVIAEPDPAFIRTSGSVGGLKRRHISEDNINAAQHPILAYDILDDQLKYPADGLLDNQTNV